MPNPFLPLSDWHRDCPLYSLMASSTEYLGTVHDLDWMLLLANGIQVYIYFNNDPDCHAIYNAYRLREMLQPTGALAP